MTDLALAPTAGLPPFEIMPSIETPGRLRRSPGVAAIVTISLAVVALGQALPSVTRALESRTDVLAGGDVWRLLTYVFPHEGGWLHVLVNMFVLALFGWQLEQIIGLARFVYVYLGAGAVGMALLFAFNPIDEQRGIRSGASLAVFGVVAAIAVAHASTSGLTARGTKLAASTCLGLLSVGGLLGITGHEGVADPGVDGFLFGFLNHALGMVAGVLLGASVATPLPKAVRLASVGIAIVTAVVALAIGAHRWS